MNREQEIRNLRIDKITRLKDAGMEAYVDPGSIKQDLTLKEAEKQFTELEKSSEEKTILGRIMIKRGVGKISFTKLFDGTGEFQVVLRVDELGKERMKTFEKLFDIGDFAEFTGTFFTTERGQESLLVSNFRMLTKALLPLPEKWHGLEDVEEKYRKRYLDILTNEDARKRFITRAKVVSEIRSVLDAENFLEVETPVLQNQASGAMAETFNTHHNDYDLDVVLRISLEAEHKMIMAGGYPAVYEIGKNFRNEGSDSTHVQEFTMIEWYKAYKGLNYNMDLTEEMLKNIAEKIMGKTKFEIENFAGDIVKIDFGGKWERVEFNKLIMEHANINLETATRGELEAKAIELGEKSAEAKKMSEWNLMDSIWKKSARRKIINPTWVTRYPGNLKPLAIQNDNGTAEVAQLVMAGFELSNHYAELVNPIAQRKLLEEQVAAKSDGDVEAMEMNNSFIEAMEYGMPPMTGTGIGIDRLVGIFTEQNNLRDTIIFPLMKPRGKNSEQSTKNKKQDTSNSEQQILSLGVTLEQANELVDKYITDPITKLHSQESQLIMQAIARHLNLSDDLVEKYGIIGLLHDLDWDMTKENPAEHSIKTAEILKEFGATDFLIDTIQSHNYGYEPSEELRDKVRTTGLQHSLVSAETLTGLIVASSLILPTKTVKDLKQKSLKKKFKTKKFAERCNRDLILECEKIGLSIDEFLELGLTALQQGADDLGI